MSKSGQEKTYAAIIADPDLEGRMKLRQTTGSVWQFQKVFQAGDMAEAARVMAEEERIDVVFISYRFPDAEIADFVTKAKETKAGQDAAFVFIVKGGDQGGKSAVAQAMLLGADGFLNEPYSVDQLVEITKLSSRVKAERGSARHLMAARVMVQEMISFLDQIAQVRSSGFESTRTFDRFRQICKQFESVGKGTPEVFTSLVIEMFEKASPPIGSGKRKKYGGVSDRVKQRMEKKLLSQLGVTDDNAVEGPLPED